MRRTVALTLLALSCATPLRAEDDSVGRLLYTVGPAQVVRNLASLAIQPGLPLSENDTLRAEIGGKIKAALDDGTVLMLWEDAECRLQLVGLDVAKGLRVIEIELVAGSLRVAGAAFLGRDSRIVIRTPAAKISLPPDGADVVVHHKPHEDHTEVIGLAGLIEVEHLFSEYEGIVTLETQQATVVATDQAPTPAGFTERDVFDEMLRGLWWTMPDPVVEWQTIFHQKLDLLATREFGRIRRELARPLLPVHTATEGLSESILPDRPGSPTPKPTSKLTVRWTYPEGTRP